MEPKRRFTVVFGGSSALRRISSPIILRLSPIVISVSSFVFMVVVVVRHRLSFCSMRVVYP